MNHTTARAWIMLDLDADAEPIQGFLTDQSSERRPFYGWLELAATIEAARSDSWGAAAPSDDDRFG